VFSDILQPTHLIFVLVVALLVLGPKRLPEVGRSLGRGLRDFRAAISGEDHDEVPTDTQHMDLSPADPAHQPAPARPAEPVAEQPTSPALQPEPAVQQPEPAVQQPEPAVQQPEQAEPSAQQSSLQTDATEQPEHVA
jgi:sec-independent protein translocase protein TatA